MFPIGNIKRKKRIYMRWLKMYGIKYVILSFSFILNRLAYDNSTVGL